jgi:hypothetical protein
MAAKLRRCTHRSENAKGFNSFNTDLCTSIARQLDARIPIGILSTLLREASDYLGASPDRRPALFASRATSGPSCPVAVVLAPKSSALRVQRVSPRGGRRTMQASRGLPSLLNDFRFCARSHSANASLSDASLLLSYESWPVVLADPSERSEMTLPQLSVWLRIFSSRGASNATLLSMPRIGHLGPQLHGFCEPAQSSPLCVIDETQVRTLLRIAKAQLLPDRPASDSLMDARDGFAPCTCL